MKKIDEIIQFLTCAYDDLYDAQALLEELIESIDDNIKADSFTVNAAEALKYIVITLGALRNCKESLEDIASELLEVENEDMVFIDPPEEDK